MKLTYFGHSSFLIESEKGTFLIDPFISQSGLSKANINDIKCDVIFVTHGHGDHFGDTNEIAANNGCAVCAIPEIGTMLNEGVNLAPGNVGGKVTFPFGTAKFLPAAHSSGVAGGIAYGFLFEVDGVKIYHAGDTGLISDFSLLECEKIDVAILPIGGMFTMDSEDAIRAAKMIKPKQVIPMHYNTFPFIVQDPNAFAKKLTEETGIKGTVMEFDSTITL